MANNTLLASDTFASGALASGWAAISGLLKSQVVAGSPNVAEPNTLSVSTGQIWTGRSWPKDQISEFTVNLLTNELGSYGVLAVRYQTATDSGYRLNLNNGTAALLRVDSGAQVSLGSSVACVCSPGDICTLAVAGAEISFYKNGKRFLYFYDATYTSGAPGFLQFSSTNLTHTKISSWRGYSVVQQDGIWQKQGIVIPALAGDLPIGVQPSSSVLFEGNAQLLSGNVYKMWFNAGNVNVGYAESKDGINWTRRSSPVITGVTLPTILKVGATYYLYAQATAGSSSFSLYNSTDGINWSLISSTILGKGTAGQWDAAFVYIFQPVAIIAGTWYGLYSGGSNGSTFDGNIGLATSPDGIVWTKYAGNPVLPHVWNSQAIANINGTFYMWVEANQPNRGGTASSLDPTEIVRYQSTDLITWTNPVHAMHNTQPFDSLNQVTGQCYPGAILDVNGQAYMYIMESPGDSTPPQVWQIGLAVAAKPIASIVTGTEDGTLPVASDSFTSGAGPLPGTWTTPTGGHALQLTAGNLCEMGSVNVICAEAYTGASFLNDQYSEITIATLTATNDFLSPIVRCQLNSVGYYSLQLQGPTGSLVSGFGIVKNVSGVSTFIGEALAQITLQVGDVMRIAVRGNVISAYQNGFQILQVEDPNNTFPSGAPGLGGLAATDVTHTQASRWAGGNVVFPTVIIAGSGGSGGFGEKFTYTF